jgi:uroporphyrinogen-III synthase
MSLTVLITRPEPQATSLANVLNTSGFSTVITPCIELAAPDDLTSLKHIMSHLNDFDVFIFVSPNAVQFFLDYCDQWHLPRVFSHLKTAAIGASSAAILEQAGFNTPIYPAVANSAELLKLPSFISLLTKEQQQRIAIFSGTEGNTLLATELSKRGASITMAYTHQTRQPHYDQNTLKQAFAKIDVITCTSLAIMRNLRTIIDDCGALALLQKPLLVISPSMRLAVRHLGFTGEIIEAIGASSAAILNTLMEWKNEKS